MGAIDILSADLGEPADSGFAADDNKITPEMITGMIETAISRVKGDTETPDENADYTALKNEVAELRAELKKITEAAEPAGEEQ